MKRDAERDLSAVLSVAFVLIAIALIAKGGINTASPNDLLMIDLQNGKLLVLGDSFVIDSDFAQRTKAFLEATGKFYLSLVPVSLR